MSLRDLTEGIEKGVDRDGFATKELLNTHSLLEGRPSLDGRPWFASNRKIPERQFLQTNADALGVKHMVQGHQPNGLTFDDGVEREAGQTFQRWGLLFFIDTGMSRKVNDSDGAALRVANGRAVAMCPDGAETVLWTAETKSITGRAQACRSR